MIGQNIIFGEVALGDLMDPSIWVLQQIPSQFSLSATHSHIVVKKGFAYPEFFVTNHLDGSFYFGYKQPNLNVALGNASLDDEYLIGKIDPENHTISFRADALRTMPLFYTIANNKLYFSSSLTDLLIASCHPLRFNLPVLAEFILLRGRYNRETIFENVFVLTDREYLQWAGKKLTSQLPPQREPLVRQETDDASAISEFSRLLGQATCRHLTNLGHIGIGAELSGGLDSSTVVQALVQAGCRTLLPVFTKLLPGEQREDQCKRITEFSYHFGCQLHTIELADKYPLANLRMETIDQTPFDPTLEPYRLGVIETSNKATKCGVNAIFTGMGGDELLEHHHLHDTGFQGNPELAARQQIEIPNFLSDSIREAFLDSNHIATHQPIPFFTHSIIRAHQVKNPFFLEQGIWPISLLADSELVNFCRRLPIRLLKRKALIRLYQQTTRFPEPMYTTTRKDSMYALHERGLRGSLVPLIGYLFQNSRLAELGLVNKEKLLTAYQVYLRSQGRIREYFYQIITLEIFLRSMEKHGLKANISTESVSSKVVSQRGR